MGDVIASLIVQLIGDGSSFEQMMKGAQKDLGGISGVVGTTTNAIGGLVGTITNYGEQVQGFLSGLANSLGINGLFGTIQNVVAKAAEMEQTEIAFGVLIGNVQRTQTALAALKKFAVETPFELPEVLAASRQMLAMGTAAENIVPTMKKLGDVASGLNIPLSEMVFVYNRVTSSGKAYTRDLYMLQRRGVPIYLELAKAMGIAAQNATELTTAQHGELQGLVSHGQVSSQMVKKAFDNIAKEGGRFGGMMEKQSQTFNGMISNLKDSLGLLFSDFGTDIIKGFDLKRIINEIRAFFTSALQWFRSLSAATKEWGFILALAGTAFSVLLGLIVSGGAAILAVITAVVGAAAVVGWPITLAIGAIVAILALASAAVVAFAAIWVKRVGGISKAIDIIKENLIAFWEWLTPIRQAIVVLFSTLWDEIVLIYDQLVDIAKDAFGAISEKLESWGITWNSTRDFIVDAILFIAYAIKNMGEVADLAFAYIAKRAVEAAYSAVEAWSSAGMLVTAVFEKLTGLQESVTAQYDEALKKTVTGFKKFKEDALKDSAPVNEILKGPEQKKAEALAEDAGKKIGKQMAKGVKEGLGDALLFGSAEHLRQFDAYLEKIKMTNEQINNLGKNAIGDARKPGAVDVGAAGWANPDVNPHGAIPQMQVNAPMVNINNEKGESLGEKLDDIKNLLGDKERRPKLEVEGADIDID